MLAIALDEIVAPVMPSTCQGVALLAVLDRLDRVGERRAVRGRATTSSRSKFARKAGSVSILVAQARRLLALQHVDADDRLARAKRVAVEHADHVLVAHALGLDREADQPPARRRSRRRRAVPAAPSPSSDRLEAAFVAEAEGRARRGRSGSTWKIARCSASAWLRSMIGARQLEHA